MPYWLKGGPLKVSPPGRWHKRKEKNYLLQASEQHPHERWGSQFFSEGPDSLMVPGENIRVRNPDYNFHEMGRHHVLFTWRRDSSEMSYFDGKMNYWNTHGTATTQAWDTPIINPPDSAPPLFLNLPNYLGGK